MPEQRNTLPLRLTQLAGQPPRLLLGDFDITTFVAADGLMIDYDGSPEQDLFGPRVTITFGRGRLDLDLDIELLEHLLNDARAKAGA